MERLIFMKVTGIIAEYNPFHNGHAYHLREARRLTKADYLLVVMGGNFMQRGEPAIVDKFARTEMALRGGADLVAELPTPFATGSAEYFAEGAVELLDQSGVVDALCFGSESGDLGLVQRAAEVLIEEPEAYRAVLKAELKAGNSFPTAREHALASVLAAEDLPEGFLSSPNNILAVEYVKALLKRGSRIKPCTVRRIGNYHGEGLFPDGGFASASAIRRFLLEGAFREGSFKEESVPFREPFVSPLSSQLPETSLRLLTDGRRLVSLEDFSLPLHYRLLAASDPLEFTAFLDVSPDLSRRIFRLRHEFSGYEAFLDRLKTRQYTRTRIARALLHILLGIRNTDIALPSQFRILGFRREAAPLLRRLKEESRLPVVSRPSRVASSDREAFFSSVYHLGEAYHEYREKLVIVP